MYTGKMHTERCREQESVDQRKEGGINGSATEVELSLAV